MPRIKIFPGICTCLIFLASLPFQGCENHIKQAAATHTDTLVQSLDTTNGFRQTQISPADSNKVLELFKKNPSIGDDGNLSIDEAFTLHGQLFLLVVKGTGTCRRTYLVTYKEGKILKCAELEVNCDTDFSQASYTYKEFSRREDTLFDIRVITEKVKDSSLVDGMEIKGNRTREDVKTVTDTLSDSFSASALLSAKAPAWPAIWKEDW